MSPLGLSEVRASLQELILQADEGELEMTERERAFIQGAVSVLKTIPAAWP